MERIIDLWPGLKLSAEPLDGDGYLVDLGASGGEILINSQAPEGRQRFTAAHEIGHWVLREHGASGVIDCGTRSSWVERWCDRFATELLTPSVWLRADLTSLTLSELGRLPFVLPRKYGVSSAMAHLRLLEELNAVAVVEFLERRGTPTWSTTVNPDYARALVEEAHPWIREHFDARKSGCFPHPALPLVGLFAHERTMGARRSACLIVTKPEAERLNSDTPKSRVQGVAEGGRTRR